MEHLIGLTMGAIPGGFGQAGNDRIPRVIVGGGIGDEPGKLEGRRLKEEWSEWDERHRR
jgi:hypothetical protein